MAEQKRDLIDGNAGEQHLDRKSVAEHVRVTALDLAIWLPDVCQLEQAAIASLPVGDRAFRIPVAAPKEVAGIRLGARRNIVEGLDHVGRERNIDRRSRFRLVEEKTVALQVVAFERDGVADAQPAPAHQQSHGAETSPQVLNGDESAARISVDMSRVEYPLEFVPGEVIGGDLNDLDLAQTHARILCDIAAADAGPEESDQAALFLLLGQLSVLPGVAEIQERIEIDLVEAVNALDPAPDEELLAEDGLEF